MGRGVMSDERLVVVSGLDLDARRELVMAANAVIERAARSMDRRVCFDCSEVVRDDDVVVGMLAMIGRNAQRHGLRIVLYAPPMWLASGLRDAGVGALFTVSE